MLRTRKHNSMENIRESKRKKEWILREDLSEQSQKEARLIADKLKIHPVVARLLVNRGYHTPEAANAFLRMETEILCDPFMMKDIRPAAERVAEALKKGEGITVYGDYDVDGVTAVCTLYLYLKSKGAKVNYYIPNRSGEGYGVSCSAVEKLATEGTELIITVDTGITAGEEVAFAKTLGVDFVVTDHHECRSALPDAVAVVNPHRPDCEYPFKELAGVGVVFKLISALEELLSGDDRLTVAARLCREYADLVAIGTIADVMPIREENKLIVSYGLKMIEKTERLGLSALMDATTASKGDPKKNKATKVTSSYIGYTIAPRINAAGRIRSASRAVELFLADDPEEAVLLAEELCDTNKERQNEENKIMEEAYAKLEEAYDPVEKPVIVLDANDWHHGVIGIVASRITEKYGLPSILVSFEGCDPANESDDDMGKGSGRSVKGLNLVDALVHCSEHLAKFGGHELAAGLSVTRGNLDAFKQSIWKYAKEVLSESNIVPTVEGDCELSPDDVTMELAEELRFLEPYGVENPVPVFVMRELSVIEATSISAGKHTRFILGKDGKQFHAICFGKALSTLDLFVGDTVDVMFNLDINEWNGRKTLQLITREISLSESTIDETEKERARFSAVWSGSEFSESEAILPTREDFVAVYNLVRRSVRSGCDSLSHRAIYSALLSDPSVSIGYVKLKVIIRVLQEMNLLGIEETSDEFYSFKLRFSDKKVDLEKSNILRKLRTQLKN